MVLLYQGSRTLAALLAPAIDYKNGFRVHIENASAFCSVSLPMRQNQFCFLASPERSDRGNIRMVKKDLQTILVGA